MSVCVCVCVSNSNFLDSKSFLRFGCVILSLMSSDVVLFLRVKRLGVT